MKFLFVLFFTFSQIFSVFAQFQLSDGENGLQIATMVTSFYNYQKQIKGENEKRKDIFRLKDAIVNLEGRYGRNIEYKVKVDFADLASQSFDAEDPGLMKAYITFKELSIKNIELFDFSMGFQDVPYSRSALVPHQYSPFYSRTVIAKGEFFNPRDIGVRLSKTFIGNIAHIEAGAYSGLGNISILGKNDALGKLLYAGRLDVAYPARLHPRDVYLTNLSKPVFTFGINYMYAEKDMFTPGNYLLATVPGKKSLYGVDFSTAFKSFSFQYELHQTKIMPSTFLVPLMNYNTDYYLAGGWYTQLNYYSKFFKSVFSARFEEFDQNDIIKGNSQRVAFSYSFLPSYGWNTVFRITWNHIIKEENVPYADVAIWTDRIRIGIQFAF